MVRCFNDMQFSFCFDYDKYSMYYAEQNLHMSIDVNILITASGNYYGNGFNRF